MIRLRLVLRVFARAGKARDGRPTTGDLLKRSSLSSRVLSTTYQPGAEALARLTSAAAELLGLDEQRLQLWLGGSQDRDLERLLELEARKMRCSGPGPHAPSAAGHLPDGWYDPKVDGDRIILRLRRCKACERAEATPEARMWERQIGEAVSADPPPALPAALRRAITRVLASGRALTYKAVADEAKRPLPEVRRAWLKAGLPEKPREGRKNFARYAELIFLVWSWTWGAEPVHSHAPATVGGDRSESIYYRHLAWLWAWIKAEQLRRLLQALGAATGRPAARPEPAWGAP